MTTDHIARESKPMTTSHCALQLMHTAAGQIETISAELTASQSRERAAELIRALPSPQVNNKTEKELSEAVERSVSNLSEAFDLILKRYRESGKKKP